MITDGRVVVWFSCGAASACAAKIASVRFPECHVVYCDLFSSEHPDNMRFLKDVETWIGKKIEIIKSCVFDNVDDVFEKRRYMSGIHGAPCTTAMKKIPRLEYQLPNDLHIFGLTADEKRRIRLFENNNPDLEFEWVLLDAGITKKDCYKILQDAGIALPAMYSLGFNNNNCIGCVKSSSPAYWDRVRAHFPEVFNKRCEQSRRLGVRLLELHGDRIFLDQLPDPLYNEKDRYVYLEPDIECGVICIKEERPLVKITKGDPNNV